MAGITKRVKPVPPLVIKDLNHADSVLRDIGALQRKLHGVEASLNETIDQAKAAADAAAEPMRAQRTLLENALAAYAEANKESLFEKRRGQALVFGEFGFRKSSEIKPLLRTRWIDILEQIKNLGFSDGVRVREDVNRDALRDWPSERLNQVGAQRVEKDLFWYEIKEENLGHDKSSPAPLTPGV